MAPLKITIATGVIAALVVGMIYIATSPKDSDNDGIPDAMEKQLGTNPNSWDSDKDNHCDSREVMEGTSPLDAKTKPTVCCDGGGPRYCVKVAAIPNNYKYYLNK